jgi:hypothetical protein
MIEFIGAVRAASILWACAVVAIPRATITARRRAVEKQTLESLKAFMSLANQMIAHATKEQVAETARILALNVRTTQTDTVNFPSKSV